MTLRTDQAPPPAPDGLPSVTADEMAEIDRVLVDEVGLPLTSMMENAGRNLADAVEQLNPETERVTVLAGKGGNGGGGLACARHLLARGLDVDVHRTHPVDELGEATATQARVLGDEADLAVDDPPEQGGDLVIDAILGYSQSGPPRDAAGRLAETATSTSRPVVSLDVPTGLDPDDGTIHEPHVEAAVTVTLALPKRGLLAAEPSTVGRLWLADIGIPSHVYRRLGAPTPVFADGPLLEIDRAKTKAPEGRSWA